MRLTHEEVVLVVNSQEGKKMRKVLIGSVIVCSLLLLSGWCLAQDTVKIGGFLPMTGAVAAYGQDANNGIRIAMEMMPTVPGKKTEFVVADTKSDKIEAANAMSRLIEKEMICEQEGVKKIND